MKYGDIKKFGYFGDHFLKAIFWALYACLIGVSVGVVGTAFRLSLNYATAFRESHDFMIFLIPLAGILIVFLYKILNISYYMSTKRIVKEIGGQGQGVALRNLPAVFIATVLTHLTGGSSGRKGSALQIGGILASWMGRKIKLNQSDLRISAQCGMAAGFVTLFGTPMAAAIFAMETINSKFNYAAMFPCLISAVVANVTGTLIAGETVKYTIIDIPSADSGVFFKVIVLGLLVALLSMIYIKMFYSIETLYVKFFKNAYLRIAAGGLTIIAVTLLSGSRDYSGSGAHVLAAALAGNALPFAFLWKMLTTSLALGTGYKGAEIIPAFVVGATFGCVIAPLISLPPALGAGVAMLAMFSSMTNCPIAAIMLSYELLSGNAMLLCTLGIAASYILSGRYNLYREQRLMGGKFSFEAAAEMSESVVREESGASSEKAFPEAPSLPDDRTLFKDSGLAMQISLQIPPDSDDSSEGSEK